MKNLPVQYKTKLNALMFMIQYMKTSEQEQENTLYNKKMSICLSIYLSILYIYI